MQRMRQQLLSPPPLFFYDCKYPVPAILPYASDVASHAMSLWLRHIAFETSIF